MIKLHWLDAPQLAGEERAHLILDHNLDWTRIYRSPYRDWGMDQINSATQLILSTAEPWFEFEFLNSKTETRFAIATRETPFATRLTESLFWCGWDSFGEFDTSQGWIRSECVLGGLPRNLGSHTKTICKFIPALGGEIDIQWAFREFSKGYLPVPVGCDSVAAWTKMGFSVPDCFLDVCDTVDGWHDAIWEYCESASENHLRSQYRQGLAQVIARIEYSSQQSLFESQPPTWARNTQRLCSQYRRGWARIQQIKQAVEV